ncbi:MULTISPECIES: hypothetical protein [Actinomycetes]|uniref:hypothetical protein n=1 Tax=Actinomycetes TaxID=1760 RepID=UPI0004C2894E|nr:MULTISPECIES: hypothetical protein [Actinomycetes]
MYGSESFRLDDTAVRAGADEFALLIGEIDSIREEVAAVDAELRARCSFHVGGAVFMVGAAHLSHATASVLDQLRMSLADHVDDIGRACTDLQSADIGLPLPAPGAERC